MALKPKKVLDVGTGFGKYGMLCREYLDLWDGRQRYEFSTQIDGVEVFKDYITPLHQSIYNNFYNCEVTTLLEKIKMGYDVVLLVDVIEHFDKLEGKLLLDRLLSKNSGVLISTPKNPSTQSDAFGNVYETHRSAWSKSELSQLGAIFFVSDNISIICYITKNMDSIVKLKGAMKLLSGESKRFSYNKMKRYFKSKSKVVKVYRLLNHKIRV